MMLARDENADGKLAKEELPSLLRNSFEKSDRNRDGVLDRQELQALAAEHVSFLPRER